MATLLPKKSGPQDNAITTNDEKHQQLAQDPTVPEIPQNSSFGGTNAFSTSGSSPFGGSSAGSFQSQPSTSSSMSPSNYGSTSMSNQPQPNLTQAGSNAAQGADVLVANDNTDWINKKWRPAMGWVYMATCTADFVLFPVLWSVLQALSKGNVTSQWQPLTLQGAGLYHIAMGAVLGIAAYGRTKEKIEGAAK